MDCWKGNSSLGEGKIEQGTEDREEINKSGLDLLFIWIESCYDSYAMLQQRARSQALSAL